MLVENKKWLSETTDNMFKNKNLLNIQNNKIQVGQKIRISYKNKVEKFVKNGVIENIEAHYIVVKYERYKESYSYVDIITSLYSDSEEYKFLVKVGKEWTRITKEMIS